MDDIRSFSPIWEGWEIDEKLGEGAYGSVWKAHHQEFGLTYYSAIKHLSIPRERAEYEVLVDEGIISDADSAKMYYDEVLKELLDEIYLMYKLRGNTHIVSYEDHRLIPKADGIGYDLFIRMELLESVSTAILQGKLGWEDVIKLGKDIAEAISLLNRQKIIHRDIKPQNIFINENGDYKLGDYGTARVLDKTATTMSMKGTYSYMAPEIYKGERANQTVDIYSLGIVMYRLMNGNRPPFLPAGGEINSNDAEEALMKRISGAPLPPPEKADPAFAGVILKACAYRPKDRYQTGDELYQALEHMYDAPDEGSISAFSMSLGMTLRDEKENPPVPAGQRSPEVTGKPEVSVSGGREPSVRRNQPGTADTGKSVSAPRSGMNNASSPQNRKNEPKKETDASEPSTKKTGKSKTPIIAIAAAVVLGLGVYLFTGPLKDLNNPKERAGTGSVPAEPTVAAEPAVAAEASGPVTAESEFSAEIQAEMETQAVTAESEFSAEMQAETEESEPSPEAQMKTEAGTETQAATENVEAAAPVPDERQVDLVPFRTTGSYVTFGQYPQTAEGTDQTPIEWLVLDYDAENNRSLLISRYGLEARPYNDNYETITWKDCSLRAWLNDEFFDAAFTETERKAILLTDIDNGDSQGYSGYKTDGGENTEDRLFLLSYAEAWTYFSDNQARRCALTDYAGKKGVNASSIYYVDEKNSVWWWLRSPGVNQYRSANVYADGTLNRSHITSTIGSIRPAFWLDLNQAASLELLHAGDVSVSPPAAAPTSSSAEESTDSPVQSAEIEYVLDADETHYKTENVSGGIAVIGYSGKEWYLRIPDTLYGKKVVQIGSADSGNNEFPSLSGLFLPDSVQRVEDFAFYGKSLGRLIMSDGVTTLGRWCFADTAIKEIVLSKKLRKIDGYAFKSCNFGKLEIPASVSDINVDAFEDCTADELIVDAKNPTYMVLDGCLVRKSNMALISPIACKNEELVVPEGIRVLQGGLLDGGEGTTTFTTGCLGTRRFKRIILSESLTQIGIRAMYYSSVEELVIPGKVTMIGEEAFKESKLKRIIVPKTVTAIGKNAFQGCKNLTIVAPERSRAARYAEENGIQWEDMLLSYKTAGSHVTLGTYPQTADGTDQTAIEWQVLDYDAEKNRSLLISKYGLDARPYHSEYSSVTWEKSELRSWLNRDFLKTAFSAKEQTAIQRITVDNGPEQGNSEWDTTGGNNTQDQVFLLSYAEAWKYFAGEDERVCLMTEYAITRRISNYSTDALGWWWLRSPGDFQYRGATVNVYGFLNRGNVSNANGCVRPALWLNLNADFQ